MNAAAFAAHADSALMTATAVGLGCAVPALVFALSKVAAMVWLDCHARA